MAEGLSDVRLDDDLQEFTFKILVVGEPFTGKVLQASRTSVLDT